MLKNNGIEPTIHSPLYINIKTNYIIHSSLKNYKHDFLIKYFIKSYIYNLFIFFLILFYYEYGKGIP